jgi:hypothetical protein
VTTGLPLGPHPCNPFALVVSPKLGLRQHVFEPPISFDIFVKPIFVRFIKIVIPPNTFQQHLLETFFQPKVREMEIDMMFTQIKFKTFGLRDGLSLKKSN